MPPRWPPGTDSTKERERKRRSDAQRSAKRGRRSEYAKRAAAGAAYLDEQYPGWLELYRADPELVELLDTMDPDYCPLGMASGDYWSATEPLDDYAQRHDLGFWTDMTLVRGASEDANRRPTLQSAYDMLDAAWKELIRDRLSQEHDS